MSKISLTKVCLSQLAFEQELLSICTDKKINAGKITDTSRYKNSNNFRQFTS